LMIDTKYQHSSFWYFPATVAEPFLWRQLPASKCFAVSRTIFNGQTRDASPGAIWIIEWRPANFEVIR
jgi:hypothetical protein